MKIVDQGKMPRFLVVSQRELGERAMMIQGPIRVFCIWTRFENCSFKSKEKKMKDHAAPLSPKILY